MRNEPRRSWGALPVGAAWRATAQGERGHAIRQTVDQQAATEALRAQAGPYRVTQDAEGWPIIKGRYGQIEHRDGVLFAVYSRAMRKLAPLVALGGRRHQIGDDEYRLLFAPALLAEVARIIKAKRRRVGGGRSAEEMARIRARSPIGRGAA